MEMSVCLCGCACALCACVCACKSACVYLCKVCGGGGRSVSESVLCVRGEGGGLAEGFRSC